MASRALEFRITGDASKFVRATGQAERSAGKLGRGVSKAGTAIKVGLVAGAAAGLYALGKAAKIGFDEFNEGQKVAAQTNAVIKSTGGVANVSAKGVDKLATALLNKSGVDDEQIKTGANMLLTFRSIRNEVGKGNDIFNQATKATLDLSVATGKDMRGSAVLVGKALNDPIRGMSALRRVGIQFTKDQEDQIKRMVETGDVMGAQKIILKELRTEFGGSAKAAGKTFAGQMNILKETFANAAGEVLGRLMPVVIRFAKFALPLVVKGLDLVIRGATWLGDKFTEVSNRVAGEGSAKFEKVGSILRSVGEWVKTNLVPIIRQLGDIFQTAIARIGKVIQEHRPELERIWKRISAAIRGMSKIVIPILRFLFTEVLPRAIGIAITALDKISGGVESVIGFFRHFRENTRRIISNVRDDIKARIDRVVTFFRNLPGRAADAITGMASKLREAISGLFGKVIDWAKGALGINSPSEVFAEIGRNVIRGFVNGVGSMAGLLKKAVINIAKSVAGSFGSSLGPLNARSGLVGIGRTLQSMGFSVGEHPAFGGVSPVHTTGSYHYKGRAIDVNWPGGGATELAHLREAFSSLSRLPHAELMIEDAGRQNQHLHFAMRRGGYIGEPVAGVGLRSGASYEFGERGGEWVIPAGRGGPGPDTIVLEMDGEPIARFVRKSNARYAARNSL